MIEKKLQIKGKYKSLYFLEVNDICKAEGFLNLAEKKYVKDYIKLLRLFEWFTDTLKITNIEKFRHENEQIYAFKAGKLRVYGFFESENNFICCEGAVKKTQKNTKIINNVINKCVKLKKEWKVETR